MQNRKHKLAIVGVCLIGVIGFKDTGIFVKDYVSLKEDNTEVVFYQEEKVNILRETDKSFLVHKNGDNHEIPLDMMINTERKSKDYLVVNEVDLLQEINGQVIGSLNKGDIVELIEIKDDYGYFLLKNGMKGYMILSSLEAIMEDNITSAIANIDLLLIQNENSLNLERGMEVNLKNYINGKYIVIDEKNNEFEIKEEHIELRKRREKVSRGASSKRDESVGRLIETARKELGKPYIYGSSGPKGYDCSGFTSYVFSSTLGIKLNRSSIDQAKNGVEVSRENLLPGDLVFFKTTGARIGHAGIYIGNNEMIHASSGRRVVMISSLDEAYYKTRYVTARRVLND